MVTLYGHKFRLQDLPMIGVTKGVPSINKLLSQLSREANEVKI